MDKIKMVVLTDVLRLVSWLTQEIGLGFPNADLGGSCGRRWSYLHSQDKECFKMKERGHNNLGENCL